MGISQTSTWRTLSNLPFIRHFSLNLGLVCLLLVLNVFSNGFDLSIYNQIQAITAFQHRFGDQYNPQTGLYTIGTRNLSLLNSIPFIAYGLTLPAAAVIGERFGRKPVYFIMNSICLIGVGVTYSSKTYAQILAGRCIINIYCAFEAWLVPLFLAEIVPGTIRGTVMSSYMFGRILGTLIINCITYKTSTWTGDESWRTPVSIMFIIPSLALILGFILPESPRWLLCQGQDETALKWLRYISPVEDESKIRQEFDVMKASLEKEVDKSSWLDLFRGTNLRRTSIALLTNFFALASGQSFTNIYQTIFLKSLGTINPFFFTIFSALAGLLGCVLFTVLIDRVGRRFFWQTTAPITGIVMMCIGGLGTIANPTTAQKNALASLFPIYGFFFFSSLAQLGAITPAEISSLRLRDKTVMAGWSVQNLTNFLASFTTPYLMNAGAGNLGSRVGFIFGSIGLAGCIWAFFFYPELKGRSLEEIDELMRDGTPARSTRGWKMPIKTQEQLERGKDGDGAEKPVVDHCSVISVNV